MKYFYLDPSLKSVPPSQFKEAKTNIDSNKYKPGDVVEAWDHVFRWNADCVPYRKWEDWRILGDELPDTALHIITGPDGDAGGTDLLARLKCAASKPAPDPNIHALWISLHQGPRQPLWPTREQISRGQAVFWRYAPQILASMLHFSLSSGFSSPRVSRILNIASYLVPPMSSTPDGQAPRISRESNDRSFLRLMETTQWMVDCMGDGAMEPGGNGWSSTVRVRLLHTIMRKRILDKSKQEWKTKGFSIYNEETDGIPISQEDMVSTLNSFSSAPLMCLAKTGLTPTQQECEDWTALWRVIGYYFGIYQPILQTYYATWPKNQAIGFSNIVTMFAGESDPPPPCYFPFETALIPAKDCIKPVITKNIKTDPYTSPATLPVLFCICNRWPVPFTFAQHCTAARYLMGETLSNWLSVPKTTLRDSIEHRFGFLLANFPPLFARWYRSGWDAKRRDAMKRSVVASISYELGSRSSKFRPRAPNTFQPVKEGDEYYGIDHQNDQSLRIAIREWGLLYIEMILVLYFMILCWPLVLGYFLFSILWSISGF